MDSQTEVAVRERAILVGVDQSGLHGGIEERLAELRLLADTAGADTVAVLTQARAHPDPKTYIGSGKIEELKAMVAGLEPDVVIFDAELRPAQQRNIEAALDRKVVDRTQLILDIFARRASTRLARWQVELAQLKYELPRFRRMWTHLSRIEGGTNIGGRGPGETQLETDRRRARERIHILEQRLKDAEHQKEVASAGREGVFSVALVGYTNAGKSTLMHALTGADVFIEDRLFATLDATTRKLDLDGQDVLLTDTVGFIRDLPHGLVASFHATLAEVLDADLLLHVCDISSLELAEQIASVHRVLEEIKADDKPVLMVFNKIDLLPEELSVEAIAARYGGGVVVSAVSGQGLPELRQRIITAAQELHQRVTLEIPYSDSKSAAYLDAHAKVLEREYTDEGVRVVALLTPADSGRLERYKVDGRGGALNPD